MNNGLYIASSESHSGKSLVSLGVMEAIASRVARPAFFRPIVRHDAKQDVSLQLIRRRYDLPFDEEAMVGLNREKARQYFAQDRYDELLKVILERFKAIQSQADFVVCEGTSFRGFAPAYEFELNSDLAANFGCAVLPVVSARDKEIKDIVDATHIACEHFTNAGLEIAGVIINAIPLALHEPMEAALERIADLQLPIYRLPFEPLLAQPTLGDIAVHLNSRILAGTAESFDREVSSYLVAAMQLPGFLSRLTPGCLVITPGDRSDIVAGSLLSQASQTSPNIAGILLTGDIPLPPQMMNLVQGMSSLPIASVETDTYQTARRVSEVEAKITIAHTRKIASGLGVFEKHVDIDNLLRRVAARRQDRITPLMFEYELIRRAREVPQRIVLPEATEPRILTAVEILMRRSVVEPILLGNVEEVHRVASQCGIDLKNVQIIDPHQDPLRETFAHTYYELRRHKGITYEAARDRMADASYFGTMMVNLGMADGLVSGAVHTTAHTIRPAFEFIKTRPGVSIVSSVFFMCFENQVLVYGDCAVNPNPTADQLAEIAISSAETAIMFDVAPRIAMLSYSTGDSGQGEDVDRVRQATMIVRSLRPDLKVDGPLQYDAAVDASVAKTKLPQSEVAGRATVFIFPDLNTGNNTYKAVQRSSGAIAVGPILQGLNKPVNDLSRGCTVPDIVNTVAITAIQAQQLLKQHPQSS